MFDLIATLFSANNIFAIKKKQRYKLLRTYGFAGQRLEKVS